MGNEFGHPEWIVFPREGNGWSFHYCRRQWSLKDNGFLKYQWLGDFDEDMLKLTQENRIFDQRMSDLLLSKRPEKTLAFYRHGLLFAFNFHPSMSLTNVLIPVPQPGEYTVALCTDDEKYGGFGQIQHITYPTKLFDGKHYVELYLPARTAVVLKERVILPEDVKEETPKRKGGRPKKTAEVKEPAVEEAPKKKPGRPKKAAAPEVVKPEPVVEEAPKKKPGRPKKAAAPAEVKPEPVAEEAPKRKPGRPKKAAAEVKEPEEAPKKTRKRKKAE